MTRPYKTWLVASGLALCLCATPAFAAEYGKWDLDGDGFITSKEYSDRFDEMNVFGGLDTNKDEALEKSEMQSVLGEKADSFGQRHGEDFFERADKNNNNKLTREEFNNAAFMSYDMDKSASLDQAEFGSVGQDAREGGIYDLES